MKNYIKYAPWEIIEEGFVPDYNEMSESLFSIGNGKMGQRANFEESYSGKSLMGNYIGGVYYPDKTRVGWWKNGYPEYFAKVLNAPNWIGIKINIDGQELDLAQADVLEFRRVLNMKKGYLERSFVAELADGKQVAVKSVRLYSLVDDEIGVLQYTIKPLNFSAVANICLDVDADVMNRDTNYDESFWTEVAKSTAAELPYVTAETKKTAFQVCTAIAYEITVAGEPFTITDIEPIERDKYIGHKLLIPLEQGQETAIIKYGSSTSSFYYPTGTLTQAAATNLKTAQAKGFSTLLNEQADAWAKKWHGADIVIEGDVAAQQGIRFNIFHLNQTYSGKDQRLNIGPKGFTGEKYGGVTYWDTEAYCIPFYLATANPQIARNLVVYRHKHLPKAIENAAKLGFKSGAALYPMVTINGEECHNEWEITFEEIHRNGAIAFAIYNYVRYTGETYYLAEHGLEVLMAISRFWAQRVNYSEAKQQYVMLGVTGPNEYENNINNNWYTSYMATWTMRYTLEAIELVKSNWPDAYAELVERNRFDETTETTQWQQILKQMYFPVDEEKGIFLQQDGFLDKEIIPATQIPEQERPICQNWSWDRILRSCYIKQADVLQGMYFFEDHFDTAQIQRNFDYYEPLTVHESSLSSCIHAILAAKLGYQDAAYRFYLNAARLDLDDYNNDTDDGLHITSMGGTWMTIVQGFGGMRVLNDQLHFAPFIPLQWDRYSFSAMFREHLLKIWVSAKEVTIHNDSDKAISIMLYGKTEQILANSELVSPVPTRN